VRAVDRRILRLLVAGLLIATALFVLRDLLSGRWPAGEPGLAAAREAARTWADAIAAGRVPLWQPSPGMPLLAVPAAQPLYPLRLLHLPFGPFAGLAVLLVLETILLGGGIYALARALGTTRPAALLAALGAQLSPLVGSAAADPALFASLCLSPWPVVFAVRTVRRLRLLDAAIAGALGALVLLAGSFAVAFVAAAASALVLASGIARGGARSAALALVACAVFLLVPAVQWLPFLEAAGGGVLDASHRGLTPGFGDLARVLLPFTGVDPPRLPTAVDRWSAEHLLHSLYLGGPLVLLAFARPTIGGERRMAAVGIVLATIALAPVAASLLAGALPGLGTVDPVDFAAPALLGIPLLAAFGVDALCSERRTGVVRHPPTGPRLALEATVALLAAVAVALWLFATDAGVLLSASVAWVLGGAVLLILFSRSLDGSRALTLPGLLAVLVVADLGGVQFLDPPLRRPLPATADVSGDPPAPPPERVLVAAGHEVVSRNTASARAAADGFDPRRHVLLDEPPPTITDGGGGTAAVTRDDPEELHVLADAPTGGWLLVADRWAPGWNAWVDGIPADVLRANGSARAVPLPPGLHQVDLRFQPRSWPVGLAVTGAGLALFALAAVLGRRRPHRRDFGSIRF
jgi:hypothetical protein